MSDNNLNSKSSDSLNGFSDAKKNDPSDVDALKNRGKNESTYSKNFSKKDEISKSSKDSDLEEKDGLKEKDNSKTSEEKTTKNDSTDKTKKNKSSVGDKLENINPVVKVTKKIKEIKIKLIAFGIVIAFFVVSFLIAYFYSIFDSFFNVVGNYFGIPEVDTVDEYSGVDVKGYLSTDEYYLNPGTNEGASIEEFVANMKADNNCEIVRSSTFWDKLDALWKDIFNTKFDDPCSIIRYIEASETEWENKEPGLKMDRALIVAGIFYGYTAQPAYTNYDDPSNVTVVSPVFHFNTLNDIVNAGKITHDDLDLMIDNSVSIIEYKYHTWETHPTNYSYREKRFTRGTGYCVEHPVREVNYSLLKWQIFMRFGEKTAKDYDTYTSYARGYAASDPECKGLVDEDGLKAIVESNTGLPPQLDSSVDEAIKYQKPKNYTGLDAFEQKATVDGDKKDYFRNFYHISFDYTTGFAYERFPIFAQAFGDASDNIEYDDAITPKEIENLLLYIYERKPHMNEILGFPDQDNPYDLLQSTYSSSVKTGEYCSEYLPVPLNEIQVLLKDCNGKEIMITSFKDYIMGVAYAETSYYNDDNVLTQMVAAINYALRRRYNYKNGSTIIMRSGDCDQAYCSMKEGCHMVTSEVDCPGKKCTSMLPGPGHHPPAETDLYNKYAALYDRASDFIVIKDGEIFQTDYAETRQKEWEAKALAGMSFTQIIEETYGSEGAEIIRCSENPNNKDVSPESKERIGSKATSEYPEEAPDKGIYYGFSYQYANNNFININPVWEEANTIKINTNCDAINWNMTVKVHVKAKSKFEKVFASMCKMLTEGVKTKDGVCKYNVSDFANGETYVPKKTESGGYSLHAYGLAQDWNYDKIYTINGVDYHPYGANRSLTAYTAFYNALGGEEKCQNVNWGGNWGRNGNGSTFDGMHFEVAY